MRILELYCGIGGMHLALKESRLEGEIVAAIDINPTANAVYKHNFPETKLLNRNIEGLTPEFINSLTIDTILMSPPCQPFTINGLQKDMDDARNHSFEHLLNILDRLTITHLLIENVKEFHKSEMNEKLQRTLQENGFSYNEYLLSPKQFGVPNSRCRYYCVASKLKKFDGILYKNLCTNEEFKTFNVASILDEVADLSTIVPLEAAKKFYKIIDLVHKSSENTCCFTKGYGRYLKGTGSIFTPHNPEETAMFYQKLEQYGDDEFIYYLGHLNLRFFSPREVLKLMSFPNYFNFPSELTNRQKYALLGNSLNVKVVAELLNLLL